MSTQDSIRRRRGRALIGCSGWQYRSWGGSFYPAQLPSAAWLTHYAERFTTVEANGTFYRLPEAATFSAWRARTPDGFVVSVKASRYLTHLRRLRDPAAPLARLFGRAFLLGPRLGPILYQLPRTLRYDADRLRIFIAEVRAQSARVLTRMASRVSPVRVRRVRHVVEFRDPSWYRPDVFRALHRAGMGICLHDMPGSEYTQVSTGPFLYVRFHGTNGKYQGSYSNRALRDWAEKIRAAVAGGRDAYAYFNNDLGGNAVQNARTLIRYVGEP